MPNTLPDTTVLLLFKSVIVPWETKLKNESGCWDVNRSREQLDATGIHLESVEVGGVEAAAQKLRTSGNRNFIIFVSAKSQMKDLFRHLRNCAAHATITPYKPRGGNSVLRFTGTLLRKRELAISGQIQPEYLAQVVAALVTSPKASDSKA